MTVIPKRSSGRPRQSAPEGMDGAQVPRGLWWDARDRVWFTREGGKRKRVAGKDAKLSDLHRIAENCAGVNRGTLAWLLGEFHGSAHFKRLSVRTQSDYAYQRTVATGYPSKLGGTLGEAKLPAITRPGVQRMITSIGETYPSKAAHLLRYLKVAFRWGENHGCCKDNPAHGVLPLPERAQRAVPTPEAHAGLIAVLRKAGTLGRQEGAVAPHLWIVAELCYLCRLRAVEAITLTDAHIADDGVLTNRRKGSKDSFVKWSPRLHEAVDAARALRAKAWEGLAVPMRPEDRPLVVSERGTRLERSSLSSAWERSKKVTGAKFGLHAMKHRGVTDTEGTRGEKQRASGHKSERMMDVYDHEVPTVSTPKGA
jgi:integrase